MEPQYASSLSPEAGTVGLDFRVYNVLNDVLYIILLFLIGVFSRWITRAVEYRSIIRGRGLFNYRSFQDPGWLREVARSMQREARWTLGMAALMLITFVAQPVGDAGLQPVSGIGSCHYKDVAEVALRRILSESTWSALYNGNDLVAKAELGYLTHEVLTRTRRFSELSYELNRYYDLMSSVTTRRNGVACSEGPFYVPTNVTVQREILNPGDDPEYASVRTNLDLLQRVDSETFHQFGWTEHHFFYATEEETKSENYTFEMSQNLLPSWEAKVNARPPWEPVIFEVNETNQDVVFDKGRNETVVFRTFGYVAVPAFRIRRTVLECAVACRAEPPCGDRSGSRIIKRWLRLAKLAVGRSETGAYYVKKSLASCDVYTCSECMVPESTLRETCGKRSWCGDSRPKGDRSFVMRIAERSENNDQMEKRIVRILTQAFKLNLNLGRDLVNTRGHCSLISMIHGALLMFEGTSERTALCERQFARVTVLYLVPLVTLVASALATAIAAVVMVAQNERWRRRSGCELRPRDIPSSAEEMARLAHYRFVADNDDDKWRAGEEAGAGLTARKHGAQVLTVVNRRHAYTPDEPYQSKP